MDLSLSTAASVPPCIRISLSHLPSKHARSETLRATRLDRIRAHVDAQLADPELSAQAAARALGMSVRSLHLALAQSGETFGQLVQRRRVAVCHALLRRPDNGATIVDIAFACGFNSLPSFYRAFRRVYGACPREVVPGGLKAAPHGRLASGRPPGFPTAG
jgi:AraC-like DNA-binding protein